ncbi:MAG: hypothetical protein C5B46_04035 [Proteobacteria bacterium]|nr:MAG: hypothetical protein C5B46_04035 [Pseudomonadota bacterium]
MIMVAHCTSTLRPVTLFSIMSPAGHRSTQRKSPCISPDLTHRADRQYFLEGLRLAAGETA